MFLEEKLLSSKYLWEQAKNNGECIIVEDGEFKVEGDFRTESFIKLENAFIKEYKNTFIKAYRWYMDLDESDEEDDECENDCEDDYDYDTYNDYLQEYFLIDKGDFYDKDEYYCRPYSVRYFVMPLESLYFSLEHYSRDIEGHIANKYSFEYLTKLKSFTDLVNKSKSDRVSLLNAYLDEVLSILYSIKDDPDNFQLYKNILRDEFYLSIEDVVSVYSLLYLCPWLKIGYSKDENRWYIEFKEDYSYIFNKCKEILRDASDGYITDSDLIMDEVWSCFNINTFVYTFYPEAFLLYNSLIYKLATETEIEKVGSVETGLDNLKDLYKIDILKGKALTIVDGSYCIYSKLCKNPYSKNTSETWYSSLVIENGVYDKVSSWEELGDNLNSFLSNLEKNNLRFSLSEYSENRNNIQQNVDFLLEKGLGLQVDLESKEFVVCLG